MIDISVIIPSYNRARVLPRALDSVLAQTFHPVEIIVVDDGSTDDTVPLLANRYPDITLIRQSHAGVSSARNTGICHSSGQWLAFLDSDDEWLPDKLKHQAGKINEQGNALLVHTDEIWIRNGMRVNPGRKHRKCGGRIFRQCLPLCCISPSSVLIKRRVFDQIGLFNERLPACEDYDMWLRICARYPVDYLDMPLIIKYGGHHDQLSKKYWGMDRFRIEALGNIIDSGVLEQGDLTAATAMLNKKLGILEKGAIKHKNRELRQYCHFMMEKYRRDRDRDLSNPALQHV